MAAIDMRPKNVGGEIFSAIFKERRARYKLQQRTYYMFVHGQHRVLMWVEKQLSHASVFNCFAISYVTFCAALFVAKFADRGNCKYLGSGSYKSNKNFGPIDHSFDMSEGVISCSQIFCWVMRHRKTQLLPSHILRAHARTHTHTHTHTHTYNNHTWA